MSDQRDQAVGMYNATWALIEAPDRTPAQDRRMLPVAHVASLLGHAGLALEFAAAAYDRAVSSDVPTWLVASTCEGLARAHAVAGHLEERDAWIARAEQTLTTLDDPEDRELIESQIATIER